MGKRPSQEATTDIEARKQAAREWSEFIRGVVVERIDLLKLHSERSVADPKALFQPIYTFDCKLLSSKGPRRFSIEFSFTLLDADTSLPSTVFSASAAYLLSYVVHDDSPYADHLVERFRQENAAFHAWPYLRQQLARLTDEMGLPRLTLPALLVGPGSSRREAKS